MDLSCHIEMMPEKTPRTEVTSAGFFLCLTAQLQRACKILGERYFFAVANGVELFGKAVCVTWEASWLLKPKEAASRAWKRKGILLTERKV